MRIGILGGTFDPIHYGHLEIAKNAQKQFALDKIFFVPAYQPPHKQDFPPSASAEQRYDMVSLAIQAEPCFEVSDSEIKRKGFSYTIDTVREFRKKYPQAEICLILGEDAFKTIDHWHRADEIKNTVQLLVAPRHDRSEPPFQPKNADPIDMPLCPVSASKIRGSIEKKLKMEQNLPSEVLSYILSHHLYEGRF